ncbi:hypothetical protein RI844_05380 [Thalassotalea fonticola]|uniref:DUF4760 domain-containing protein n=1 Tax=Thalassotalea fonticola TaxID=3065649 RepID=A0ABZ0GTF0_9GAMM|nr:hypothetical protein RI844_05380 [Colwelliaceae bacterium S1-1]
MSLAELVALAEICGGFAVLATLIYLVVQLKENARLMKAKATTATFLGWSQWNDRMSVHPNKDLFIRSFHANETIENFSPEEIAVLDFIGRAAIQRFMAGYFQYKADILDNESWHHTISFCHSFLALPFWSVWWQEESKQMIYSEEFIEAICSAPIVKLSIGEVFNQQVQTQT